MNQPQFRISPKRVTNRPVTGHRSGYGTTSVALNSTVECSADRSAYGHRDWAPMRPVIVRQLTRAVALFGGVKRPPRIPCRRDHQSGRTASRRQSISAWPGGSHERLQSDRPHGNEYAVLGGCRVRCHQSGKRDASRSQGRRRCRAGHPPGRGRRDHVSDASSRLLQVRSRRVGDTTHRAPNRRNRIL
jgi:hypothetical protein